MMVVNPAMIYLNILQIFATITWIKAECAVIQCLFGFYFKISIVFLFCKTKICNIIYNIILIRQRNIKIKIELEPHLIYNKYMYSCPLSIF